MPCCVSFLALNLVEVLSYSSNSENMLVNPTAALHIEGMLVESVSSITFTYCEACPSHKEKRYVSATLELGQGLRSAEEK